MFSRCPKLFLFVLFLIPFSSLTQTVENKYFNSDTVLQPGNNKSISDVKKPTRYKPHFIANLSSALKETSGLLFFNRQLWTINDSGNKPEIYQVDSANGSILRTVMISNAVNKDWESITQDDSNIYIGDFGNNAGNRTDMLILKISKTDLLNLANDSVKAVFIYFNYPDQSIFATAFNTTNFDCEAFFCQNDSLHLFSKNWLDLYTKHYVLPVDTGNYTARLTESFNADGLITDASVNASGNIVLLGYKKARGRNYRCFAWILSGYDGSDYFGGDKRRIKLGSAMHLGQTEGVVLKNDNTGWISSESIGSGWSFRVAKLFGFDFGGYFGKE